ncbi:cytochrome c biogenesis protein [Barrientosiimonas humi]|uniref:Cytochrome c biogenesis protein n=3 Tax=Barrientosiimonas TaxID=1535207 RepID=A0A542X855_9MICO|nr:MULTISPECIES: cytochrome c biogenesis protein ResB [Barrientosiimonas]TQL32011.1 cytochrome c biogenesis protein [Barrientosiimonas humi]BDZ56724.1 cytochrome c biogenesis protein ResB [Barrientosiimonas endolithica]CAG7571912.1 Cytochrome c biogenesis protein CcsB [Barrientosiimonas humi]
MTDQKTSVAPADEAERKQRPGRERTPAPRLGVIGMARWFWRQLTAMRTALFLLLLLAIAALPGSIWPQRGIDAARVADYLQRNPELGPWLDRFGFFDVYSTPWFAAIYLLLVISLLGCVIPRMRQQWRASRAVPPVAPRRLKRLPSYVEEEVDGTPEDVFERAREVMRGKRFRTREGDTWISGEVGLLRELGNLIFHVSLVVIIVSMALGNLTGWRGDVIVPEGTSFASTASRYDTLDPGPWVDVDGFSPWTLQLNDLSVNFEDRVDPSSTQYGQPRDFRADITTQGEDAPAERQELAVNHPVRQDNTSIYLLGNGYAPRVTVRDAAGKVIYQQATPFLPQDNTYTSTGAIKVTGASPQQLGFYGFFLPTLEFDEQRGPVSTFPGLKQPALVLGLYSGNLFPQGKPQSVYTLDTQSMTQVKQENGQPARLLIRPGETVQLPNGLGSISLDREVPRWAGLSVRSDPGKMPALVGAIVGLFGLLMSLVLRRRRLFVRVAAAPDSTPDTPRTLVQVGGLAKHDDPRLDSAVRQLLRSIVQRVGPTA